MSKLKKGFTLIELLVVIGILAILLAITLIAINPARQFGQANDTRRRSDVLQILNAVHQYTAEHGGILPTDVLNLSVTVPTYIRGSGGIDLCPIIVGATGVYMPALPVDPAAGSTNITICDTTYTTGYQIERDANNRITVRAPSAYGGAISITR